MDENKIEGGEKVCLNKFCPDRLYEEGKVERCKTCQDRYDKDFFCVYCQQVYF